MFHSALTLSSVTVFYAVAGTRVDLLFNAVLLAYFNRQSLASHAHTTIVSVPIILLLFCLGVTLAVLVILASPSSHASTWQGPGQPYLIPCRTTHRRFSPKKHSFSYSYLTVGIPVDFNGSFNGMIGVDEKPSSPFRNTVSFVKPFFQSWYHIQASDYLQRDDYGLGLRGKLNRYIQSEGVDPTDYPFAYLITAARFAGYNFNPVSLWYLYTSDKTLSAIVLQVNNTFDERRPYLLIPDAKADPNNGIHGQRRQIKGSRVKDFHVSPFNSRKGYYSVTANDPLGPEMNGFRGMDVTIILNSSNGHPKLVARLCSDGPAVSPMGLGPASRLLFLAKWFWVGFATLPRIFWQAAVLLYLVKLKMWDKPEPLVETLGRHPTSAEETLEVCFSEYLEFLVRQSGKPISVKYYTSGLLSGTGRLLISSCGKDLPEHDILELRVLTPAFYSRFIQYCDSLDALFEELNNSRTICVKKPELLQHIFGSPGVMTQPRKLSDRLFASLLRHLRQRPPRINLPSSTANPPRRPLLAVELKQAFRCSMDAYILSNESEVLKTRYKRAAFHQLAADRYFGGQLALLTWMTTIFRIMITWACITFLTRIISVEH